MTPRSFALITAGLTTAALTAAAGAANIEFNDDGTYDDYGFSDYNPNNANAGRIVNDDVSGGVLSGVVRAGQTDPQLRRFTENGTDKFSFDSDDFVAIEIRLLVDIGDNDVEDTPAGDFTLGFYNNNVNGDPRSSNSFPPDTTLTSATRALTQDNAFDTYRFDFTEFNFTNFDNGIVEGLRIDPINNSPGASFQIDSINLVPVPEPTSIAGLAGVGLLALRRRRA